MEKIVYKGNISGDSVVIRYPQKMDVAIMRDFINEISKEKTYIRLQGEEFSMIEETKYVDGQLKKIIKKETVQLLLFVNGELSGVTAIELGEKIKNHIGVFGITISQKQRGKGYGKLIMKLILEEASKNIPNLKMVTLECFAENEKAINLYKSFGFVEYGRLPKGNLYKEKYVDDVSMYKNI
ncbi:MAG TPA: GNAT family protein [Patescibacteria group bacterium]|nr:GNAT family protein [Patescibacteria group bacterium]